jgi:hypoxanthine phosphoribosyltransferase
MEHIKESYTWDYYHTLVSELRKKITPCPNIIIGIGKGGLVPGIILAENYGCTLINYGVRSYNGRHNNEIVEYQAVQNFEVLRDANILIVDDIADTGNTFNYVVQKFKKNFCENLTTASVFYKPKSTFKPDYFAREMSNSTWIVQPWETPDL